MKKRYLSVLIAIFGWVLPLMAQQDEETLIQRLQNLRYNLQCDYEQMSVTKDKISDNYEIQHQRMVNIMKQCNELSLRLYSQKQEYTLDLCFALEKVKNEFEYFNKDRIPYDRIVGNLDIEIERYARLIESLRRLPPEKNFVANLPDSLAFHNDSLDTHIELNSDNRIDLTVEVEAMNDSVALLFVLDEVGQRDRDTCIFFTTELLKMYAESRDLIVTDSIHYQEAYLRLKESYDYAQRYYTLLQKRIFIEGQIPWLSILSDWKHYRKEAFEDMKRKYSVSLFDFQAADSLASSNLENTFDTLSTAILVSDTNRSVDTVAYTPLVSASIESSERNLNYGNWSHLALFIVIIYLIFGLLLNWIAARLILIPVFRFVKPLKKTTKIQRRYISLLVGILFFVLLRRLGLMTFHGSDMFEKAVSLTNTYLWLITAIVAALLIRLDSEKLKLSIHLYRPTMYYAMVVIGCRAIFMPNLMMNYILPPGLILFFMWQLIVNLRLAKQAEASDRIMAWASLSVTGLAMLIAVAGYIFAALLILIWWFFQLAVIHTMTTIWYLITIYKEKRLKRRIDEHRERITFVSGADKEKLMFGATWFYDLIKEVVLPVIAVLSIPGCINLSLDVFDFDDLYNTLFFQPFYQYISSNGESSFRLSFHGIILLIGLAFAFRYANRAIHYLWQQARYALFLRKHNRKTIRKNEINLTLGNSIISVSVWMVYAIIVFITLKIPTGSLGLVAGGFSAGVGLAMKDIINNFVYGIQLMTGRLKIGDWIECDGVRGHVTDINYQSIQVETINDTTVSFLNSTLFAKNYTNLTKSNSYELLTLRTNVVYGSDIQKVREAIEKAMQVMRTKDPYGREVVEPNKGIYVVFGEFSENGVEVWVKQYVLAAERIAYIDRAKEVIYNALNDNGFTIPIPQRDVHVINDET